jgi:hypothetical protein
MNKLVKSLVLVVVMLMVAAFAASMILSRSTLSTVNGLHEQIREAGDPLYFTDYANEPIPNEQNAYFYLMQASSDADRFNEELNEIQSHDFTDGLLGTEELSQQTLDALAKQIDASPELFANLDRAAKCPRYRAEIDYDQGIAAELPHTTVLRATTRALTAQALVSASRGDGDGALMACVTGLHIQRHVQHDPTLITLLSALASQDQLLVVAHRVLVTSSTSEQARNELDRALAEIDNYRALIGALKGERSLGVLTFKQLREGKLDSLDGSSSVPGFVNGVGFGQAYVNDDESTYIRLMNESIELVNQPRSQRTPALESMEQELNGGGFRQIVTRLLLPSLLQAITPMERVEARLRCLQTFRALQDQDAVDQMEIPTDPFTGNPLVVKKRDEEWLIYSVGPNLQDDQGDISIDNGVYRSPDIGFGPTRVVIRSVDRPE